MSPTTSIAAQQALDFLQQNNWLVLMHSCVALLVSVAVAFITAPVSQAVLESLISSLLPGWAFPLKPLLPLGFSYAVSSLITASGKVPGFDIVVGTTAMASGMHWVNEQPWAADFESKFPKLWSLLPKSSPSTVAKALLVGFLLMAVTAKATDVPGFVLGPSLGGGSGLYTLESNGLAPAQSAVAWASEDLFYGHWASQTFSPAYIVGLLVGLQTAENLTHPVAGVRAGWIANGVPVTAFMAWPLDQGGHAPVFGLGSSFQFDYIPGLDFAFNKPSL